MKEGERTLDAVVAQYPDRLSVLAGNGSAFLPPQTFTGPGVSALSGVALADLGGDGTLDIVEPAYGGMAVVLGNGDRTFWSPATLSVGLPYPHAAKPKKVLLADLNGDGKLDLVWLQDYYSNITNTGTALMTALGHGDGTFGAAMCQTLVPEDVDAIGAGDFTGDGVVDIAVVDVFGKVEVVVGNHDGTLHPTAPISFRTGSAKLPRVAFGDFNGDGVLDIATVPRGLPYAYVGLAVPGQNPPAFKVQQVALGQAGYAIAEAPGMAGHLPDLQIVTSPSGNTSQILTLHNNGDGTFDAATISSSSGPAAATYGIAAGDLDGDGVADLALSVNPNAGNHLYLFHGNGDGTFSASANLAVDFAYQIELRNVTLQTVPDVVTFDFGHVSIVPNHGDGTFGAPVTWLTGFFNSECDVGDVNGDGLLDIVSPDPRAQQLQILLHDARL